MPTQLPTARFLAFTAAFGLAAGLLEGLGLLLIRGYGIGNPRIPEGVSGPIVGISAVVNLCLFLAVGIALLALNRVFKTLPLMRAAIFVFSFLLLADLLGVTGRISPLGVIALSLFFLLAIALRFAAVVSLLAPTPGALPHEKCYRRLSADD